MQNPFTVDQLHTLYNITDDFIKSGQVPDGEQGYYLELRESIMDLTHCEEAAAES